MTKDKSKFREKKIRFSGKIWRRIVLIIIGLIIGINIYSWNASTLAGNSLPMPFGVGASVVMSGSMSPTLEVNDLIVVQKKASYEVGDIVVYQSGKTLIVHRIIDLEENMITTQGDANNAADDPINVNTVKGEVVFHIPFLGAIINVLKTPIVGFLLLIGAFILMERSFKAQKREKEKSLDAIKEEICSLKEELSSDNTKDSEN